jgi:hypothetical protein
METEMDADRINSEDTANPRLPENEMLLDKSSDLRNRADEIDSSETMNFNDGRMASLSVKTTDGTKAIESANSDRVTVSDVAKFRVFA